MVLLVDVPVIGGERAKFFFDLFASFNGQSKLVLGLGELLVHNLELARHGLGGVFEVVDDHVHEGFVLLEFILVPGKLTFEGDLVVLREGIVHFGERPLRLA